MARNTISVDTKKQLHLDFKRLYYHKPHLTFKEIALELQFGEVGTVYENLHLSSLSYFHRKFGFSYRDKEIPKFKPKKAPRVNTVNFYNWKRENRDQITERWKLFKGTWSEFESELRKEFNNS